MKYLIHSTERPLTWSDAGKVSLVEMFANPLSGTVRNADHICWLLQETGIHLSWYTNAYSMYRTSWNVMRCDIFSFEIGLYNMTDLWCVPDLYDTDTCLFEKAATCCIGWLLRLEWFMTLLNIVDNWTTVLYKSNTGFIVCLFVSWEAPVMFFTWTKYIYNSS